MDISLTLDRATARTTDRTTHRTPQPARPTTAGRPAAAVVVLPEERTGCRWYAVPVAARR